MSGYADVAKIKTQEAADEYFDDLVGRMMAKSGKSREETVAIQRANIGYFAGYFDPKTAKRVWRLFRCAHPIFGTNYPGSGEAFAAGKKICEMS